MFWKKAPAKTVRVSSMTMGQALSAARKAGTQTGDTGLFDQWLENAGLSTRGNVLVARMRREYEEGFEERFQSTVSEPELSRKLNLAYLERVKKSEKAPIAPVRLPDSDRISELYANGKASTLKEALAMLS